jgi:hypothetical protein
MSARHAAHAQIRAPHPRSEQRRGRAPTRTPSNHSTCLWLVNRSTVRTVITTKQVVTHWRLLPTSSGGRFESPCALLRPPAPSGLGAMAGPHPQTTLRPGRHLKKGNPYGLTDGLDPRP